MGFEEGNSSKSKGWGIQSLMRRKQVDSDRVNPERGHHQLAKELSVLQLIAIGINTKNPFLFDSLLLFASFL